LPSLTELLYECEMPLDWRTGAGAAAADSLPVVPAAVTLDELAPAFVILLQTGCCPETVRSFLTSALASMPVQSRLAVWHLAPGRLTAVTLAPTSQVQLHAHSVSLSPGVSSAAPRRSAALLLGAAPLPQLFGPVGPATREILPDALAALVTSLETRPSTPSTRTQEACPVLPALCLLQDVLALSHTGPCPPRLALACVKATLLIGGDPGLPPEKGWEGLAQQLATGPVPVAVGVCRVAGDAEGVGGKGEVSGLLPLVLGTGGSVWVAGGEGLEGREEGEAALANAARWAGACEAMATALRVRTSHGFEVDAESPTIAGLAMAADPRVPGLYHLPACGPEHTLTLPLKFSSPWGLTEGGDPPPLAQMAFAYTVLDPARQVMLRVLRVFTAKAELAASPAQVRRGGLERDEMTHHTYTLHIHLTCLAQRALVS
jgi:hypothetical protein